MVLHEKKLNNAQEIVAKVFLLPQLPPPSPPLLFFIQASLGSDAREGCIILMALVTSCSLPPPPPLRS